MMTGAATQCSMFGRICLWLASVAIGLAFPAAAAWALPDNLSGGIQLSAATGNTDGEGRSSLSQRYTVNWNKRFLPYLTARAAMSYDRFGTEVGDAGSIWREQIQPVGELGWDHPLFTAAATLLRHESRSQDDRTAIVRRHLGLNLRTRLIRYPILTLRFDSDDIYNKLNRDDRDTREQRLQAGLTYTVSGHSLFYSFTERDSDIRSEDAEIDERTHLFRWDQATNILNSRFRVITGYNFSRRTQTSRREDTTATWRPIAVAAALYAEDASPEFGPLDSARTLTDGNIDDQALPTIDIGQNRTDQNLGVDFGFSRTVQGMYIYTDRPSGFGVTWSVYLSNDNLTWERLTADVRVGFNTSFSRYEVFFDAVRTRYVKAVKGGLNDILTVLVTEIEALEESGPGEQTRTQTSHQANAAVTVALAEELQTSVDLHYRTEPSSEFSDGRDQLFYGASLRHTPSTVFMQSLNYQAGWEEFQSGSNRMSTAALSYALIVNPLQTVRFTLSGATQRSTEDGVDQQQTHSAQLRSTGAVLREVSVSADVGFSRSDQALTNQTFDTWTYRTGIDVGITRWLDAVVTYLYQSSQDVLIDQLRIRRQVTLNTTLHLSRSVLLRGNVARSEDNGRDYMSQEYSGVWRLSPKTSLSALASIIDGTSGVQARRWSTLVNHKLSPRTTVTVSYVETETGDVSKRTTSAFQVGLRTGF